MPQSWKSTIYIKVCERLSRPNWVVEPTGHFNKMWVVKLDHFPKFSG